jgi:hypothetical protein
MIELLGGGVIGSLLGGLFRLAPEILKWVDRKDERKHELAMFQQRCELEKQQGSQKLAEIGAQHQADVDTGVVAALHEAIRSQTDMVMSAGPGWVTTLSASVRPIVTYLLIGVYLMLQVWMAGAILVSGGAVADVFKFVITPDYVALVAGILNYHFLNRTLEKRGLA